MGDPGESDEIDVAELPDVAEAKTPESRTRLLRKLAEKYIEQIYPGGVPVEVSSGKLHQEVKDAMKAEGRKYFPSLSTVKRAAKRRTK